MFRFNTNVLKKNVNYSMEPLNKALNQSIKDMDLSNADVERDLNGLYTSAAIGNYRKGIREVPSKLVRKWKEHYGHDLMAIAETFASTNETNVSRETQSNQKDTKSTVVDTTVSNVDDQVKVMPMDVWNKLLKDGDRFDEVLDLNKEEIRNLWILIHDLRSRNLDPHKAK